MEDKNFSRRDFITTSFKTIAIGTIALSALDLTGLIARASEKFEKGNSEKVINLSDYPELQSVGGYSIVAKRVIVIRASQTKFIALNLTCTHKQCEVEYDKHGKVTQGPAKKNLTSYKTEYNSDDDTLTIDM
jgi:Rieske Fe-S protein